MGVINDYNVKFEYKKKVYMKKVFQVRGREEAVEAIHREYPNAKILKTYVAMSGKGEIL